MCCVVDLGGLAEQSARASRLGLDGTSQLNLVPERFRDGAGWTALPTSPPWPLYGHLFLLVDGRVFYSGGQYGANNGQRPSVWDRTRPPCASHGPAEPGLRNQAASVLLPPAHDQRVMIVGGGGWDPHGVNTTTATTAIVDLTEPHPGTCPARCCTRPDAPVRRPAARPDRAGAGGAGMEEDRRHAAPGAEIYHPGTNRGGRRTRVPRLYHSSRCCCPTVASSRPGRIPQRKTEEMRVEVFWPPYLFAGPRPSVTPAQQEVGHGHHAGR